MSQIQLCGETNYIDYYSSCKGLIMNNNISDYRMSGPYAGHVTGPYWLFNSLCTTLETSNIAPRVVGRLEHNFGRILCLLAAKVRFGTK